MVTLGNHPMVLFSTFCHTESFFHEFRCNGKVTGASSGKSVVRCAIGARVLETPDKKSARQEMHINQLKVLRPYPGLPAVFLHVRVCGCAVSTLRVGTQDFWRDE